MDLNLRIANEIISHEAIVQEAYLDSEGVWTWSVGITDASGHQVHPRYLDNPQSLERCLEVYVWLVRLRYIPDVEEAFAGHVLTEGQFCAALSFHYNTGGILSAQWVREWKSGQIAKARRSIMNWRSPPEIIPRREKERDLFFDDVWTGDGRATVYDVRKPAYTPRWSSARKVDVSDILEGLLGA
jgi:lysozyme